MNEYDSAAARADHFMPRSCGVYYFEVTIMNKSREGYANHLDRLILTRPSADHAGSLIGSSESASVVKVFRLTDCPAGNQTHGATMAMMESRSVARAQVSPMARNSIQTT